MEIEMGTYAAVEQNYLQKRRKNAPQATLVLLLFEFTWVSFELHNLSNIDTI